MRWIWFQYSSCTFNGFTNIRNIKKKKKHHRDQIIFAHLKEQFIWQIFLILFLICTRITAFYLSINPVVRFKEEEKSWSSLVKHFSKIWIFLSFQKKIPYQKFHIDWFKSFKWSKTYSRVKSVSKNIYINMVWNQSIFRLLYDCYEWLSFKCCLTWMFTNSMNITWSLLYYFTTIIERELIAAIWVF